MSAMFTDDFVTIHHGDAWELAPTLAPQSIHTIVTSPPYWGLRDYGEPGQFGLESTPEEYVARLVDLFALLRPALRDDGTVWLNLGDSFASSTSNNGGYSEKSTLAGFTSPNTKGRQANGAGDVRKLSHGLKHKDLVGIPWRVAFALQADGWYLRSDIIWHKPNPMPESVTDRPTKAHEYIFLLSKKARYYYDYEAIKDRGVSVGTDAKDAADRNADARGTEHSYKESHKSGTRTGGNLSAAYAGVDWSTEGRNKRSVWTVPTRPFSAAHFATFPPDLIKPCIKAGCPEGGTVLDPFMGSGTTAQVARSLGRKCVGFEMNDKYIEIAAEHRLAQGVLL